MIITVHRSWGAHIYFWGFGCMSRLWLQCTLVAVTNKAKIPPCGKIISGTIAHTETVMQVAVKQFAAYMEKLHVAPQHQISSESPCLFSSLTPCVGLKAKLSSFSHQAPNNLSPWEQLHKNPSGFMLSPGRHAKHYILNGYRKYCRKYSFSYLCMNMYLIEWM